MTIAVDIRTGQVVGQVTELRTDYADILPLLGEHIVLLTSAGYIKVLRSSVRLENIDSR